MKIILITKHYVKNYGSVLQAYASQELLSRRGDKVYVANYILPEASGLKYMDIILRKHASGSRVRKMQKMPMKAILPRLAQALPLPPPLPLPRSRF